MGYNQMLFQPSGALDPYGNQGGEFQQNPEQLLTDGYSQPSANNYSQPSANNYSQSQEPMLDPKRMAWAQALSNIGSIWTGQGMSNSVGGAYAQAKAQNDKFRQNRAALGRQAEQDEQQKRLNDSRIFKNYTLKSPGKGGSIGSPLKLENGNFGIMVEDKTDPKGYRVVDTGTEFRGEPNLGERLQFETALLDVKERGKYQDVMIGSEKAYQAATTSLSSLQRANELLAQGVETGTFTAIFSPEWWLSDEQQELQSLINEAVLAASTQMAGVLSESDMKFLKGSTISKEKSPEANRKILERKIALIEKGREESTRKYDHFKAGGNFFDWKPEWEVESASDSKRTRVFNPETMSIE